MDHGKIGELWRAREALRQSALQLRSTLETTDSKDPAAFIEARTLALNLAERIRMNGTGAKHAHRLQRSRVETRLSGW